MRKPEINNYRDRDLTPTLTIVFFARKRGWLCFIRCAYSTKKENSKRKFPPRLWAQNTGITFIIRSIRISRSPLKRAGKSKASGPTVTIEIFSQRNEGRLPTHSSRPARDGHHALHLRRLLLLRGGRLNFVLLKFPQGSLILSDLF